MARLGDQARIVIAELGSTPVSLESPLEDQAILVFRAVRRFAEINGFKKSEWGGRPGRSGPFVMKWFEEQLFPAANKDQLELLGGRIGKVLRVSGAAVCLKRPAKQGDMPVWFVANEMPDEIVAVAQSVAQGNTVYKRRRDESELLNRNEQRVTAEEAGETREPGDVVTQRRKTRRPEDVAAPLRPLHEERRRQYERNKQLIYELVATSPIPMTAVETHALKPDDATSADATTIRKMLNELVEEGRLVVREETADEKLVRGGGQMPMARRARLYAGAPGPIPERTRLPDGIEPQTPSLRHAQVRKEYEQRILDYLENEAVAGGRTTKKIFAAIDDGTRTFEQFQSTLKLLVRRGKVHHDNGHRYYVGPPSKRTETAAKEEDVIAKVIAEAEAEAPETPEETELVLSGSSITDDPRVRQLLELLSDIVMTPGEDTEQLKREIDRLKAENAQLRDAVEGLKRAIATGVI